MSIKSFDTLVPSLPRDYISIKCSESLQYSERENIDDDSENIDDDSAGNFEKIAQNRLGTMQNKNVDTKLCNKYSLPTTLPNCLHHKNLLDPSHPVFVYSIIPKFEPIYNTCLFCLVIDYPLPEEEVDDKDQYQNGEYSIQDDDNTNVVEKRTINVSTFFKIGCSIIGTGSQYVYLPE